MMQSGAMNLQSHLMAGVTTIRDNGARNRVGFSLKEALEREYIAGPRILVCGRPITTRGGHFHMCNEIADGPADVRRAVQRLVGEGADHIKIMASGGGTEGTNPGVASYAITELEAAALEAHSLLRRTVAHCTAKESMVRAIAAGIDQTEHVGILDPHGNASFDAAAAEVLARSQAWICPTLVAWTDYPRIAELTAQRNDGALSREGGAELGRLGARAEERLDVMRRTLEYSSMHERILPGTDSGVGRISFGHLDHELQPLVRLGLTPGQALVAATRVAATAIGLGDEIGTIEPGKIADLAAFDGDPSVDVGAFSRVVAVFQEGARVR